jgi:signal transduction histidine kinase
MPGRFLWLFIFIFVLTTSCSQTKLHDDSAYFLLEDRHLTRTADSAWQSFKLGEFKQQSDHSFNPGFTTSYYWLVVKTDTASDHPLFLEIGTSQINVIEFYTIENQTPRLAVRTGDYLPYSSRPLPSLNFVFPLTDHQPYHLLKVDKRNESLQLTFFTKSAEKFQSEVMESSLVIGLMTGGILLMIVFGVFLFLITKEKVYLFYCLYVAAGWLYVLANQGYGYKYLWPDDPWFAGRARPVFALLTMAFSLHFIEYYIGKAGFKWLHWMLVVFMYLSYALFIVAIIPGVELKASAFGYYFQALLPVLSGIYILILLTTLGQQVLNKNRMAMFYLLSMLPIVLFSTLQITYYSGGIDFSGSYLQLYGQATGYVLEAIILTFGLAYRFNSYKLDKERVLMNLNQEQARYAKAIISTQQNERRQIADQLHDVAGSLLSAARLNLSSVREKNYVSNQEARIKLESAESAISDISEMLRDLSHAISPVMLDKVGFRQSVEKVVSLFNAAGKVRVELELIGFEIEKPTMYEKYTVLYGILYELMNNIVKHANASHALVQLIEHEDSVVMIVEDNGTGLDQQKVKGSATHGLAAIQSKVHYLEGTVVLDKASPHGLIVTIELPKRDDKIDTGR